MGRTVAGVLLVLSLAVVAAGCGSSSKPAVAPSTTPVGTTAAGAPGGGAQSAAFEAFRSCLQKAGIDSGFGGRRPNAGTGTTTTPTDTRPRTTTGPRPGGGFGGARANLTPAQQKAFDACRSKLPAGAGFGRGGQGGGPGGTTANPAFAQYTKCLAQHGVTFGTTPTDPTAFQKASAACAKYRPSFGGGAGGGGSGVTTTTG